VRYSDSVTCGSERHAKAIISRQCSWIGKLRSKARTAPWVSSDSGWGAVRYSDSVTCGSERHATASVSRQRGRIGKLRSKARTAPRIGSDTGRRIMRHSVRMILRNVYNGLAQFLFWPTWDWNSTAHDAPKFYSPVKWRWRRRWRWYERGEGGRLLLVSSSSSSLCMWRFHTLLISFIFTWGKSNRQSVHESVKRTNHSSSPLSSSFSSFCII
jgi:hypothetical protein